MFSFLPYFRLPLPLLPVCFLFSVFSIARFPACFKSRKGFGNASVFSEYGVYFEPHIYIYIYIYIKFLSMLKHW